MKMFYYSHIPISKDWIEFSPLWCYAQCQKNSVWR